MKQNCYGPIASGCSNKREERRRRIDKSKRNISEMCVGAELVQSCFFMVAMVVGGGEFNCWSIQSFSVCWSLSSRQRRTKDGG